MFLVPRVGDFPSRQIGVFTGSGLILLLAYLWVGWLKARTRKQFLVVGTVWLALTVSFELVFGHYVFGRSWQNLGEDYNLAGGGLMSLGLVVLMLAPLLAAKMRNSL